MLDLFFCFLLKGHFALNSFLTWRHIKRWTLVDLTSILVLHTFAVFLLFLLALQKFSSGEMSWTPLETTCAASVT